MNTQPSNFHFQEMQNFIRTLGQCLLLLAACAVVACVVGFGFVIGGQIARSRLIMPLLSPASADHPQAFPMLTCYYAHPMELYGTRQESDDIQLLESLGFHVVNPNAPEFKSKDMAYFGDLAARADLVAFRALADGKISSGVALEIKRGKRAIELPSGVEQRSRSAGK